MWTSVRGPLPSPPYLVPLTVITMSSEEKNDLVLESAEIPHETGEETPHFHGQ